MKLQLNLERERGLRRITLVLRLASVGRHSLIFAAGAMQPDNLIELTKWQFFNSQS